MAFNSLTPIHDRVLVRLHPRQAVTKGGIHLPQIARDVEVWGTVCACGEEVAARDVVKEGMDVLTKAKQGTRFVKGGEEFLVLHENEIIAVRETP